MCGHRQAVFNDEDLRCTVPYINYKINSGIPELFHGAYYDCQILKFRCKQLYYAVWKNSGIQLFILFKICDPVV